MLSAKGVNGTVEFDGQAVTIRRTNRLMGHGKSVKTLPISGITGVQLKPATTLTSGYIQFVVPGEIASKGQYAAGGDENAVVFNKKVLSDFAAVDEAVQQALRGAAPGTPTSSPAEELKKMHELLQAGIITEADFESAKAKFLA